MAVRGDINDLGLTNLIQLICYQGNPAQLHLTYQSQTAVIYFGHGEILHAVLGSLSGEEAFFAALNRPGGHFELLVGETPVNRTIVTPWSMLLLDAVTQIDEQRLAEPA